VKRSIPDPALAEMIRQFRNIPEADFAAFGAVQPTLAVLVVVTVD
jgi:hypothetical protein